MKKLFTLLTMLLLGIGSSSGQIPIQKGLQVTSESSITSGKAYILKTGANRYITDAGSSGSYYDVNDNSSACASASEASVYYLISNGDGTWKIKNYYTGKYWGVPVYNAALTSVAEASAGAWSLNISSGIAYPSAPDANSTVRGIDRSDGKVWGWTTGTNNNHKVYIYEVALSTTALSELVFKDIDVASDAAASLSEGQWYIMSQRSRTSYVFENTTDHKLKHTLTKPSGSATNNAGYLVRLINAGDGKYYLQNGYGNYMGAIAASTNVPTTALSEEAVTVEKIAGTDGHYYVQCASNNVVLNANDFTKGDPSTVVGWGTTAPTSTGNNNDWAFYPVTFKSNISSSDVWTINNTNDSRGAMMYAPTQSTQYVWSSGKNSQTFDPTSPNCQWVLYPTGTEGQFYLYNVGSGKFAIPSGTASGASWIFSSNAVAVTLIWQSDGTYKIKTATTDTYAAVSNGKNEPIINYNDEGGNFTITKVDGDQSAAVTAAVNKLVDNQTALTAVNSIGDGWYAIRISTHDSYADRYVYHSGTDITYNGTTYPLTFDLGANIRPAIDDATYYVHMKLSSGKFYLQLPDGRYLYGSNNKFPIPNSTEQTSSTDYTNKKGFRFWGSQRYAVPYYLDNKYFIGETYNAYNAYYDLYPIDLTTAGLTAWSVEIEGSTGTETATCNRNDFRGLGTVYNNGYIFLPTGTTPSASDFSADEFHQIEIDGTNKIIKLVYKDDEIDTKFTQLKTTTKFTILEGSTVMGPREFDNPEEINAAIDAAQEVADNSAAKYAFIESTNGTKIQNYLDQVDTYGALANIQITMSKEYGTLILPCPCTRIDGLDIYSCNAQENNTLTLTPVDGNYVQNVPYIIHATERSKYTIIGWDKGGTETYTSGWLTGVLNSITDIPSGSYMLATNKTTGVQAFYKVSGSGVKCAINKCYLTVPVGTEARTLYLDIDGEITAIEEVFGDETEQGAIYNLAGQRLTKAQKGINIINGKKVLK